MKAFSTTLGWQVQGFFCPAAGTTLYLAGAEFRLDEQTSRPARSHARGTTPTAGMKFLAADRVGTAEVFVDSVSQAVTRRRSDPFGNTRGAAAPWTGDRGFVGGTMDPSTGLTHLGAREYDPVVGRFLSVDPIIDFGDPQQLNAYVYANNSPVTFSDPDGLRYAADGPTPYNHDGTMNLGSKPRSSPSGVSSHRASSPGTRAGTSGYSIQQYKSAFAAKRTTWQDFTRDSINFPLGWYDAGSFGLTTWVLKQAGLEDLADEGSRAYVVGGGANTIAGLLVPRPIGKAGAVRAAAGAAKGAKATRAAELPAMAVSRAQVEKRFKHAVAFGVTEPKSAVAYEAFGQRLDGFVKDPTTVRVSGTYHNDSAILNYYVNSRLVVVQSPDGAFVSGWRMSAGQLQNVVSRNSLGGG